MSERTEFRQVLVTAEQQVSALNLDALFGVELASPRPVDGGKVGDKPRVIICSLS